MAILKSGTVKHKDSERALECLAETKLNHTELGELSRNLLFTMKETKARHLYDLIF